MRLKDKIFDYLQDKQTERHPRFPHLDKPLKVLVIYESDMLERNDSIKSIRHDLLHRGKDVSLWGFVAKKEITTQPMPQNRILGLQDYNFWGKPTPEVLEDLTADHYDLLIDLTTRPCLSLRYLAMFADADFKVGLNMGEGIHDMLISLPNFNPEQSDEYHPEATFLYDQIIKYLTAIRSND